MADVLVADDQEDVLVLLRTILELEGHGVALASDGCQLVEKAVAATPDVIILDVMMPNLDGVSALRMLRQHASTADVPVIVLSGKGDPGAIDAGFAAGANSYLVKPFDPDELVAEINRACPNIGAA